MSCTRILIILLMSINLNIINAQDTAYRDYKSMTKALERMTARDKSFKLQSLGKTLQGRDIWVVSASHSSLVKPAICIVGGVDATDLVSTAYCMRFIRMLTDSVDQFKNAKWFQNTLFYIIPRVNPDASEAYFDRPLYERSLNTRPLDLDNDGKIDEDGYEDLNGDNIITWMRIKDPAGDWLKHEKNPFLMRKADSTIDESGEYLFLSEGIDNDKDGRFNEDEPGGVDFNQNFAYRYEYFTKGSGLFPISEPETKAVAEFCFDHPNIFLVFCFSNNHNLIQPWPKGNNKKTQPGQTNTVPNNDYIYYKKLTEMFKKIIPRQNVSRRETGKGAFSEWAYFHYGRWSVSSPSWWIPTIQDTTDSTSQASDQNNAIQTEIQLYNWLEQTQPSHLIDWKSIDHPDFPAAKVEVGGFYPFSGILPPKDSLQVWSGYFNRFFRELTTLRPVLEWNQVKVESLGDDLYRLTVLLENTGVLPTATEIGKKSKWLPKVIVQLTLTEQQQLIKGQEIVTINKIAGTASQKLEWVLAGKRRSEIRIQASCAIAGYATKIIRLE